MGLRAGKGTSAESRLALVRVKLNRAKKHLADFEAAAEAFRGQKLHVVGTNFDPKTAQETRYHTNIPKSGFEVLAIAGDVLQNLRSTLDHLAFELVSAAVCTMRCPNLGEYRGEKIEFPIGRNAKHYKSYARTKIERARKSAVKLIDALKPYKGGNYPLWRIHYLNTVDKHRQLLPVAKDYLFTAEHFDGAYWRKHHRPILRGIFGSDAESDSQATIKKPRRKVRGIKPEPLLAVLHESVSCVEGIIELLAPELYPRRERT